MNLLKRRLGSSSNSRMFSALQDYEAALIIEPKNEEIIEDAQKLREVIQSADG